MLPSQIYQSRHYTTNVKNARSEWVAFDDVTVNKSFDYNKINLSEPYVLMYTRQSPTVESAIQNQQKQLDEDCDEYFQ